MLKFYKIIIFLLLCIAGMNPECFAQITKRAQTGFRFLDNPVAAEAIGRGETGMNTMFNSNGIFWNPALLGKIKQTYDVSLNYTKGIADIDYNAGAASFRVGDFCVLGFSILAMDYGTFYGTRRDPTGIDNSGYVETGEFSPKAYALGFAFSQEMSDRFSYGIHIKYVSQNLGDAWVSTGGTSIDDPALTMDTKKIKTDGIAADIGAFYDFKYHGITFAAALHNFSREYKFDQEEFPLPFSVSFGTTIEPLTFIEALPKDQKFILSFESKHPRDYDQKFKVGAEYNYMDMFIARMGYMSGYEEKGYTAGLGLNYKVSDIPFRLDYAFLPFGVFGSVHHLSLSISYN